MKLTENFKMITLAGLLVAGAGVAHAKGDHAERFAKIDADGNGEISQAEITTHGEARFAKADTDGDGYLNVEEIAAQGKARHAKRAGKMLERLDTDGDGKIAPSEMSARRDPAKLFEKADKDGNGTLSVAEFEEASKHRRGHGKRHKKPASE